MEPSGRTCTDFLKKNLLADDNNNVINVLPDSYLVASLLGTSQMIQKNKTKRKGARRKKSIISSVILGEDDEDDDDDGEGESSPEEGFEMGEEDGIIFLDDEEENNMATNNASTSTTKKGRTVELKKSNYVVTDYDPIASYLASIQNDGGEDEDMNEIAENAEIGGVPIVHSYNIDVHKEKDDESGEIKYRTKKKRIKHGDLIRTSELNIRLRIMEQCIHPTVKDILDQRKVLDDPDVQREIKKNKERHLERIIDDIIGSVVHQNK